MPKRPSKRKSKSPLPKWKKQPIPVAIEALRKLVAAHGQDVGVLVTWSLHDALYGFTTVGSDRAFADAAVRLRDEMAKNLKLDALGVDRDLRHQHPNVKLTKQQLWFLLWLLGRTYAESEKIKGRHRTFVLKYHDELMPVFGEAYEELKK